MEEINIVARSYFRNMKQHISTIVFFSFFHSYFNFFDLHLLQVTNVAETLGLGKKTPMGIFLDEFGIEPEVKYM